MTVVLFAHLAFFNFVPRLLVKVCNFVRLTNTNRAAADDDPDDQDDYAQADG